MMQRLFLTLLLAATCVLFMVAISTAAPPGQAGTGSDDAFERSIRNACSAVALRPIASNV